MENNDPILDSCPTEYRDVIRAIVNGTLPVLVVKIKKLHGLERSLKDLSSYIRAETHITPIMSTGNRVLIGPSRTDAETTPASLSTTVGITDGSPTQTAGDGSSPVLTTADRICEIIRENAANKGRKNNTEPSGDDLMIDLDGNTPSPCAVTSKLPEPPQWLKGYFRYSLPTKVNEALTEKERATLLYKENCEIAFTIKMKLEAKHQSIASRIDNGGVFQHYLDFINEKGILSSFSDKEIDIIVSFLQQQRVQGWTALKAKGIAALEGAGAMCPTNQHSSGYRNAPPLARSASNPNAAVNKTIRKNGKGRAAVNTVGDIHIPSDLYNILSLGGEFTRAAAQKTFQKTLSKEIIKQYFDLPPRFRAICTKLGMTADIYDQVHCLFTYIASTAKEHNPAELWAQFWDSANSAIAVDLCDQFRNGKNKINCYKRLETFMFQRRIIAKMADKNAGLTLIKIEIYHKALMDHIQTNPLVYEKRDNQPKYIGNHLKAICRLLKINHDQFWDNDAKIVPPALYLMPKLHKSPIGWRPIIPSHSWYTTAAAKWLHNKLWPLVKHYHWVITDRLELIQQLEDFHIRTKTVQIATLDVTAMYTNIEIKSGINRLKRELHNHNWDLTDINVTAMLLEWVLTNNYFTVNNQWYQQIKGAAMGGNASGVFADLVVASMELEIFNAISEVNRPLLYRRYRDDILIVAQNQQKIKNMEIVLNEMSSLTFNIEQMGNKVHFLDLEISRETKYEKPLTLLINPYSKPMTSGLVTHFVTYKPEETKTNWIIGENIRLLRGSQSKRKFNAAMNSFKSRLLKAGYPPSLIRSKMRYGWTSRNWLLMKTAKKDTNWLPMETTKNAHQAWNFMQNNFKPLLKYHNIRLTAHKGRTTMDVLNMNNKQLLAPKDLEAEQETTFRNRNRRLRRILEDCSETDSNSQ